MTESNATILLPPKRMLALLNPQDDGAAQDSFSVEAQGYGSVTGLGYTVPAHANGSVKAELKVPALTSANVDNLNDLIKGMVSASQYEKIEDYEAIHASANLGSGPIDVRGAI